MNINSLFCVCVGRYWLVGRGWMNVVLKQNINVKSFILQGSHSTVLYANETTYMKQRTKGCLWFYYFMGRIWDLDEVKRAGKSKLCGPSCC